MAGKSTSGQPIWLRRFRNVPVQVDQALARLEESRLRRGKVVPHVKDRLTTQAPIEAPLGAIEKNCENREFFLADMFDLPLKCDGHSLQAPIFSLSTKPDRNVWEWRSKDEKSYIKVVPSVLGRATQHDKDILIFVISQLVEGRNRGRADARNRTVRFRAYDLLVATNRQTSGDGYRRLREALERLSCTKIMTNIQSGGQRFREGFGLIDRWRIVEQSAHDTRMVAIEITLSEWLFSAVRSLEVLTLDPAYFELRSPLARRLYEIARKHCGYKGQWSIGLELLRGRVGSHSQLRDFRRQVRAIQAENGLPGYRLELGGKDRVTFFNLSKIKLGHEAS